MELMTDWLSKNIRILDRETDGRFTVKRGQVAPITEDEPDGQFDTYMVVPAADVVVYPLRLPAQVEDNLADVVRGFVMEREPVSEGIKVDYGYLKEKGQLKVLATVIREDRYRALREDAGARSPELSGIVPFQNIAAAVAVQDGMRNGLALFRDGDTAVGCYLADGFPMAFLKTRVGPALGAAVQRFLSGQRAPEDAAVTWYGDWSDLETLPVPGEQRPMADTIPLVLARMAGGALLPMANLLPPKERKVHRKLWRYVAMALVLILLGVQAGFEVRDYLALRSEVQTLRENFEAKRDEAKALRKKLDLRDRLKAEAAFYADFHKKKERVMKVLDALTTASPADTYATSINIQRTGQLDFNGKSKDVYRLIRNLNESKSFSEVQKQGSAKQGADGYTAFLVRGKINE